MKGESMNNKKVESVSKKSVVHNDFGRNAIKKDKELLTDYECKILEHVALGLNNVKISRKLYISEHTVKARIATIYRKLDAGNRANAVYIALKSGFIN